MARTIPTDEERDAIVDLISRSELQGIEFHEVSARRLVENKQRKEDPDSVDVTMTVEQHVGDSAFGVRLTVQLLPFRGEINVAVAAEYATSDKTPISPQAVRAFGNEVALMTIFPYAREAISTVSLRVFGQPTLLPTLDRGLVGFDLDE